MTAKEIIEAAFQDLGIIEAGASLNFADLEWALSKFNRMLNSMSADGINLHYRIEESFPLVVGTASYTIGTGGTFNTARPNVIEQAFIRDTNGHDYTLGIRPIGEYWSLSEKTTQSRPTSLYYKPTYPYGTIYLYYTPADSEDLHIVSQKPLTTYTSELTSVSLPGEYEEALVTGLAVKIAPRYGIAVSPELRNDAMRTQASLRARNFANTMKSVDLHMPGRTGGTYDIDEG